MNNPDRDAVRKTVEGAMSTAEGRWTGNPVDITNSLVDFLQWESDKYKARAEAAERKVARREAQAEAWDEGYNAGKNDMRNRRPFYTQNPHRAAEEGA